MVYAIYIAAAAVIGLLIGLVTLSILWLRKTVLRNIRSKTVGLISVYDELLERKSRKLADAGTQGEAETDRAAASAAEDAAPARQPAAAPLRASELLGMAERSGGAVYRDRAIGGIYLKIRENFSFRMDEILPLLADTAETANEGPACRLLKELKYDTVYRLSTMLPEEQKEILRETLPADGVRLLDDHLRSHPSPFSVLNFYDQLRDLADAEPKGVFLRVPRGSAPERVECGGVVVIPDDEICEGFQLEEGQILYDYCIKERELS